MGRRGFLIFFAGCALFPLWGGAAWSRSALSPRHSGMEAPGGPRSVPAMPSHSPSRTSEGGMGYMDAYGNTVENTEPEAKEPKRRLNPGAYGARKENARGLPHVEPSGPPLWNFR